MEKSIKKITIVSMFISLGIIFSYISNFIPFFMVNFLKIDLSIIFILAPLSVLGLGSSIFISIVIGCFNFIWSTTNFIGPIILIISNVSFVIIYSLIKKISKLKIISIIITLLIHALFLALLNGLIFTPFFLYIFTDIKTFSFIEISQNYNSGLWYDKLKVYFLFMPNYWSGIFTLYTLFNLFKFSIGSILFIWIDGIIIKNNFSNYFL